MAIWDPNQYHLQAKKSLQSHQYDLAVIFIYLGNDAVFEKRESFPKRSPAAHPWRLPKTLQKGELTDAILYPFKELMEGHSHLYVFWKNSSQQLLAKMGLTAYYFPDVLFKKEEVSPPWSITADIISAIVKELQQHATPSIVVLLPTPSQVHPYFLERHMKYFNIDPSSVDIEQPNRLLTIELKKRYVAVIDMVPVLREAAASGATL